MKLFKKSRNDIIVEILESIISPNEYGNELNSQPSWLTMPNGKRAVLDVFFPALPLVVTFRRKWEWKSERRMKDWLEEALAQPEILCPHITVGPKGKLTREHFEATMRKLCLAGVYPEYRTKNLWEIVQ